MIKHRIERFKQFLQNPLVTLACLVMSFVAISGFAWNSYSQANNLRNTFCGVVQPYTAASTGPAAATSPEQLKRIVALRDGFSNAEERLHCTVNPFDNK